MSVLVEALCLVVPRLHLDLSWPGGTAAFLDAMCEPDCPSRRLCADDTLVSVSFLDPDQADVVGRQLRDHGLFEVIDGAFVDYAFVDQHLGPTMPCPWLRWHRHPDGFTYAWLTGSEPGMMAAPLDWTPAQSRALRRTDLRVEPGRMLRLAQEGRLEVWLDYLTGRMRWGLAEPEAEAVPAGATFPPPPPPIFRPTPEESEREFRVLLVTLGLDPDTDVAPPNEETSLGLDPETYREIIERLEADVQAFVPIERPALNAPSHHTTPDPDPVTTASIPPHAHSGNGTSELPVPPIENSYIVPGTRLVAGEYPGSPPSASRTVAEAKLQRFLDAGVTAFVDLTGPADGLASYEPTLRALAEQQGLWISYEPLPIPDMDVCDDEQMWRTLDVLDARLAEGHTVYVHCWGGVGRTGTTVGCWLVRQSRSGDEALAEVARLFATMSPSKVRRHATWGSPQTAAQRDMVRCWSQEEVRVRGVAADTGVPPAAMADPTLLEPQAWLRPWHGQEPRSQWAFPERPRRTRLRGCLLGGAIGDALGWPVEFLSLAQIRARYGEQGITDFDPAAPGGPGAITDDTQMALFTAEGVLRATVRQVEYWAMGEGAWTGMHEPHSGVMWRAYSRWLQTQSMSPRPGAIVPEDPDAGWLSGVRELHVRRAPGNTCLASLRTTDAFPWGGSVERPINQSKGCGGVMRVAPIGLVPCADPFAYGVMAAALTHGHPSGYLSAGAFAQIVSDICFMPTSLEHAVQRAIARLDLEPGGEETASALRRALALAAEPGDPSAECVERLGGGWTGEEALAIGVYCALVATSFAHGVRLAVNHSGDSDSTGCIAGALLGLEDGEDGISAEWRERVELAETIMTVADDLYVGYGGGSAWRARYPGG